MTIQYEGSPREEMEAIQASFGSASISFFIIVAVFVVILTIPIFFNKPK